MVLEHGSLIGEHILDQADRDLCGLLHDVSELAGDQDLALALGEHGLDVEYLASDRRPRKARDHSGVVVALINIAIEWRFTQKILDLCRGNLLIVGGTLQLALVGNFTEGLVDLLLELTNTALTGITLNNHLDGSLIERRLQA